MCGPPFCGGCYHEALDVHDTDEAGAALNADLACVGRLVPRRLHHLDEADVRRADEGGAALDAVAASPPNAPFLGFVTTPRRGQPDQRDDGSTDGDRDVGT
jgi:hypothetical protein